MNDDVAPHKRKKKSTTHAHIASISLYIENVCLHVNWYLYALVKLFKDILLVERLNLNVGKTVAARILGILGIHEHEWARWKSIKWK